MIQICPQADREWINLCAAPDHTRAESRQFGTESTVVQLGNEAARSKEDATLPLLVIPLVAWKHWEHTIEVQH
jgi:hypothetical protein